MEIRHVEAVYFSPTGNVKKITEQIASVLGAHFGAEAGSFDFTLPEAREKKRAYGKGDIIVFGMPVYAGRVPNKLLSFVQEGFEGNGALAIPVCSYGNRSYGDALTELKQELEKNGFCTAAAAAIPSEHSFAEALAAGRPDDEDLEALAEFAEKAAEKIAGIAADGSFEEPILPGDGTVGPYYRPLQEDGTPAVFLKAKPKTKEDSCTACGICAESCPMGSISRDNCSEVAGICIKCQACVRKCPKGAKYFDDEAFLSHRAMLLKNYIGRKENEFFL